jgi:hypothetical protein
MKDLIINYFKMKLLKKFQIDPRSYNIIIIDLMAISKRLYFTGLSNFQEYLVQFHNNLSFMFLKLYHIHKFLILIILYQRLLLPIFVNHLTYQ